MLDISDRILARFRERTLLRRLIGNTFWQMSDKVLRMIAGLLVGIWVARYLGPLQFGLLNFAIAFVALFTPLADLGLQAVVVRELVKRKEDRFQIVVSALALRLIGATVATVFCLIAITLARPGSGDALLLVAVIALSLFPQACDVIEYDFQARTDFRPIMIIRSTSLVTFAAVKIALIVGDGPLTAFAWAVFGEAALSALMMVLLSRNQARTLPLSLPSTTEMKYLVRSCWPLAIASLSVILYMRIDQVMLGAMLDDTAVGVFSAAVRISESWYFVPMAIAASVAPALTSAHQENDADYRRKLLSVIRALCWIGVVAAGVLTIASDQIIRVLYGSGYERASDVLAVHAWGGIFACLGIASGPWFLNAGLLTLRMVNTLIGALANCALNLYAIPRYGAVGAAMSTLVSYALAGFILNAFNAKSRPVFWLQLRSFTFRYGKRI